jgi:hypothetical protein
LQWGWLRLTHCSAWNASTSTDCIFPDMLLLSRAACLHKLLTSMHTATADA